jgi:hypothetical protein
MTNLPRIFLRKYKVNSIISTVFFSICISEESNPRSRPLPIELIYYWSVVEPFYLFGLRLIIYILWLVETLKSVVVISAHVVMSRSFGCYMHFIVALSKKIIVQFKWILLHKLNNLYLKAIMSKKYIKIQLNSSIFSQSLNMLLVPTKLSNFISHNIPNYE